MHSFSFIIKPFTVNGLPYTEIELWLHFKCWHLREDSSEKSLTEMSSYNVYTSYSYNYDDDVIKFIISVLILVNVAVK